MVIQLQLKFVYKFTKTSYEYLFFLQSGDVALLLNWRHHAYVSSTRGSFACEMLPKEMQPQASNGNSTVCTDWFNEYCNFKSSVSFEVAVTVKSLINRHGVQKPAPTSSDAFWQFECFEFPVTGISKIIT